MTTPMRAIAVRTGRRERGRSALAALVAVAALLIGVYVVPAGAADVTAVKGQAFGYHADNITLFGGPQPDTGPTPMVTLASDASNSPQPAAELTGLVQYGPATLFSSDAIIVSSLGTLGPNGSVSSSSDILNINKAITQPATGSEVFTADRVRSTCTADSNGTSGSVTITNGTLRTHSQATDHDEGVVGVPTNPAPNTTIFGHIHLSATQTDYFKFVFNEQVANPDGSLTVNAVHEYFGVKDTGPDPGSILKGDLILGHTICGVS